MSQTHIYITYLYTHPLFIKFGMIHDEHTVMDETTSQGSEPINYTCVVVETQGRPHCWRQFFQAYKTHADAVGVV